MRTPLTAHSGTIYDAQGAVVAICDNAALAALICERVNTWQAQYAAGYEAATAETNARRDHELCNRLAQAEQRGYARACEDVWFTTGEFTPAA